MKALTSIKGIGGLLLACGIAAVGGRITGCSSVDRMHYMPRPSEVDFTKLSPGVLEYGFNEKDGFNWNRDLYVRDGDGDGRADSLGFGPNAFWATPELMQGEHKPNGYDIKMITPEIQDKMNKFRDAAFELSESLYKEQYKLYLGKPEETISNDNKLNFGIAQ